MQGWPFLSVVWRQFVKLDFLSSTIPYSGSGLTWHHKNQAIEWVGQMLCMLYPWRFQNQIRYSREYLGLTSELILL